MKQKDLTDVNGREYALSPRNTGMGHASVSAAPLDQTHDKERVNENVYSGVT